MTSQECAEVLALIRAAILEERERTAAAAGLAASQVGGPAQAVLIYLAGYLRVPK